MIKAAIALVLAKHFICDFPLQTTYMMGKFSKFPDFIKPLAAHCAVHAAGTVLVCLLLGSPELALTWGMIDFVSHFIMDRVKADHKLLGRWGVDNKRFWWALGFDQLIHGLVYAWFIGALVEQHLKGIGGA